MRQAKAHDLLGVQALRAVAAFMVVAFHAVDEWAIHHGHASGALWPNGSAGVDVFFVISGLVMTISVQRNGHRPHPAWNFARDRLVRIVPLYWIVTTLKIVAVLALPALVLRTRLNPLYVAGSYLLLPVHDWTGVMGPVLPVGWTLVYEMFFYGLVTAALFIRAPMERVCVPIITGVAILAIFRPGDGFANTIVLEFLCGMALGRGLTRLQTMPVSLAAIDGLCGLAALVLVPLPDGRLRPLIWGFAATMVVASVVAAEHWLRRIIPHWLLAAGNASYATYLTHGFVVPAVYLVISRLTDSNTAGIATMLVLSLLLGALGGQITHTVIERPLLLWLRGRRAAVPAMPAAG